MPSQTFKSVMQLSRLGPEVLRFNMKDPMGYLYTVIFKDGRVKMGASVRPTLRISEQYFGVLGIEKIVLSEKFQDYRSIEKHLVSQFQIFLPEGWNGGPREVWKLPKSILAEVLSCYDTGFTSERLDRIGELCEQEYQIIIEKMEAACAP